MKIKILKDIPGLGKDSIHETVGSNYVYTSSDELAEHRYYFPYLIKYGYAEEVKEIDIEAIRQDNKWCISDWNNAITFYKDLGEKELQWFSAYRVISEVIRQLNGDWVADWNDVTQSKYEIVYTHDIGHLFPVDVAREKLPSPYPKSSPYKKDVWYSMIQQSIIPPIKDFDTSEIIIKLCLEELLTLFNIK